MRKKKKTTNVVLARELKKKIMLAPHLQYNVFFFFFRAGEGVGDKVILSLSLFVAKRKRHAAHGVSKIKMTRQNNKAAVEIPRKCEHVIENFSK